MNDSGQVFDIDMVYLWVDGRDPAWAAKKNRFLGIDEEVNTEALSKARNMDNGELMYSLRSAEKNIPWIRRIFIVTDEQFPNWLNLDYEKVKIVDIREIIPPESLPCYNSVVIEHCLWKIQGLSEHFLYANDDMFFNAPLTPDFFFTPGGFPVVRLQPSFLGKQKTTLKLKLNIHLNLYRKTIHNAALLIEKKFGRYFSSTPHHNVDAYLKSDYKQVSDVLFKEEISKSLTNHTRSEEDVQRIIYLYYALAVKRGKRRFVDRRESCRIRLHKPDFNYFINKYNPILFCLNDTHHATDADRSRVEPFLNSLFPDKSAFEL